jgi:DNA-binding MarR family transcriptional regulator
MTRAPHPLSPDEEALWRALTKVITILPRALDEQFLRDTGVTMTEYSVLVALSEATGHGLRLSELASRTSLSLSRISRVVNGMANHSRVTRRRCASDGRSCFATLTAKGLGTLEAAYPGHLARARRLVFDHLAESEVKTTGPVLIRIAEALRSQADSQTAASGPRAGRASRLAAPQPDDLESPLSGRPWP